MIFCEDVLIEEDYRLFTFLACCTGLGIYNALEVIFLAFSNLKNHFNIYVISLLSCSGGIILNATGLILVFYGVHQDRKLGPLMLLILGWFGMVSGFSFTMYSRLTLVKASEKIKALLRYVITFNALFTNTLAIIISFGTHLNCDSEGWLNAYSGMEKIQVSFFFCQEVALSLTYLYCIQSEIFMKSRKLGPLAKRTAVVNGIVLVLDSLVLLLEYAGLSKYQVLFKVAIYSTKLKMEFYILNLLSSSQSEIDRQFKSSSKNAQKDSVLITSIKMTSTNSSTNSS